MHMITKYDEFKYFIIDADVTQVAQLMKLNGNGWGTIKRKNGKQEVIDLERLLSYDEKQKAVQTEPNIEKINFFIKNPNGTITVKTLEGEDAVRWEHMMVSVCMLADKHKCNPNWLSLNWKIEDLPREEKQNG